MYKNKKILTLIPARGQSKGLPGKNIKLLNGKPLISWTIEVARESIYSDKVIVSTDDEAIATISRQCEAEVPFLRPEALAQDNSPTIDVIFHALEYFKQRGECFDYLVLLEPTSPLRKKGDIDNGIKKLIDNETIADSLVSLGEIALEHPSIAKKLTSDNFLEPFYDIGLKVSARQQLSKAYFPYGVIYLSKVAALEKTKTFYQKKTLPYFIERWQNYEIDDMCDFICIQAIMKFRSETIK